MSARTRDDTFLAHVLDLLEPVGAVAPRAMMGGHLVFCRGVSIALLFDDRLYLKVDAQTQAAFAEAGGEPFVYESRNGTVEMSYWTPPDGALEEPQEMRPWAQLALEAALRAKRPAKKASGLRKAPSKVKVGARPKKRRSR
ncbi:TfoX/Sxy family protein [Anaeromyxobacter paludicola]|uniref:TfoX N-terminal domain-containing protein n=1 Tax=Anaeromyxobacter paludicola TaxID=2918171 RepID=A0ABM7X662_9BACT|nr:TfoX/Sxy family protein [Anaeromyxobacter paludicola]BDG07294.1 hypothetical protein AMPC_04070 [Anaeromyxobacter paludicola]